jgi:hypothetical protein
MGLRALASFALTALPLAVGPAQAQPAGTPSPYGATQSLPQPGMSQPGLSQPQPGFPQPGYSPQPGYPPAGGIQGGTWSWPPQGSAWPVQPGAQETVAPDAGQAQPLTPGAPAQTHVPGFVRTPSAPTPAPGQDGGFPPPQFSPPPQ